MLIYTLIYHSNEMIILLLILKKSIDFGTECEAWGDHNLPSIGKAGRSGEVPQRLFFGYFNYKYAILCYSVTVSLNRA